MGDAHCTTVRTYLEKEKKLLCNKLGERGEKMQSETTLKTMSVKKVGKRCSRHWSRASSPAGCGEDHGGTDCPPAAHASTMLEQVSMLPTVDLA